MWFWLWLVSAGLEKTTPVYPPAGCILLQRASTVPLSWQLSGQRFQLEILSQGSTLRKETLTGSTFELPVTPGTGYGWTVTSNTGQTLTRSFSVARDFEFHRDGKHGIGEPGGRIEARLERDAAGMNLFLTSGKDSFHYLFAEPGLQFLISARGGDGKTGGPGQITPYRPCRGGQPGGTGGWGGDVRITTVSVPWRDYLRVDVSPGKGGPGGPGGVAVFDEGQGPEGEVGPPGRPGTVTTFIAQP